ncbi:MAG: alkaline phosphatase family protein [Saonia sp.]
MKNRNTLILPKRLNSSILFIILFFVTIITKPVHAQKNENKPRVVLISVDGAADWILDDLLAQNVLSKNGAFGLMRQNGMYAEQMIPVNVAATAVSHTSIFTGANPGTTGVVGNNFLAPNDIIKGARATSGFNTTIEVEALWNMLKRQNKKVTTINAVGADNTAKDRRGTNTFSYGKKLAGSSVQELTTINKKVSQSKIEGIENYMQMISTSKMGYTISKTKEHIPLYAFAVDSTFDGEINYDRVILDFDLDISNGYAGVLQKETWVELKFKVDGQDVAS